MTSYIQGPNHGKATYIETLGGTIIDAPASYTLDAGHVLVVVVDNGAFEAAAVVVDDRDWQAFNDPSDMRAKTCMSVPTGVLELLLG